MANIQERKNAYGKTFYRVRIRIKGQKMLSANFDRKTDAVEWAKQTEVDIKRGRYLADRPAGDRTIAELIDRYLRDELPKRQTDQQKVRTQLAWWRSEIGYLPASKATPSVLAACRDKLLRLPSERNKGAPNRKPPGPKGPATVIRYMASMSHVLSVAAREWEWLDNNPMPKVRRPQLPQQRVRFLDDTERRELLSAAKASACEFLYPVVVLALSTGARYSEIMNLRWKDIDLPRGIARLEQTKNRERRALPLAHHALQIVRRLHDERDPGSTELLFPRSDGRAPMDIRKHWNEALKAARIRDFRFHDLRHSAASYLAMNGASLAEIAEVLGHKTLQMVKRYAHLSE